MKRAAIGVGVPAFLVFAHAALAHYNMLLPQTASAQKGQQVHITYQWGHPFEHQLFDAPAPHRVYALTPAGKKIDLGTTQEPVDVPNGQGMQAHTYRLRLTLEERGDYLLVLETPPIWMEEEKEFWQDTVKAVLHVQAQKGWEKPAGEAFEAVPLTRPYGLEPGMVFQAQVLAEGRPAAGTLVEIERYNPEPPKELPPDEHVTRTARTDPNGVATCTLTEPGWWCLTASRQAGQCERDGKAFPLRHRTSLWVFVDDKPAPKTSK